MMLSRYLGVHAREGSVYALCAGRCSVRGLPSLAAPDVRSTQYAVHLLACLACSDGPHYRPRVCCCVELLIRPHCAAPIARTHCAGALGTSYRCVHGTRHAVANIVLRAALKVSLNPPPLNTPLPPRPPTVMNLAPPLPPTPPFPARRTQFYKYVCVCVAVCGCAVPGL